MWHLCCLQETEILNNYPENVLSTGGYNLELELNDCKKKSWNLYPVRYQV
jgi:hypothetical protein